MSPSLNFSLPDEELKYVSTCLSVPLKSAFLTESMSLILSWSWQ